MKPDAVFTLMDLAVEASGIGLQVRFPLHESPSIGIHPVETPADMLRRVAENIASADPLKFKSDKRYVDQIRAQADAAGLPIFAGLVHGNNHAGFRINQGFALGHEFQTVTHLDPILAL